MSPSEKAVAAYILKNPEEVILLSMRALAEKTTVSDNTVFRFCRTCGFSGYLDFKTALVPQIISKKGSIYQQVGIRDQFSIQKDKISENICHTIKHTFDSMAEEEIGKAAEKIAYSSMTVVVGLASSYGVSMILADSLLTLGIPSLALADRVAIERTCSSLKSSTVLVGFTHSGETEEVFLAVRRARENRAFTILVSNNLIVKQEVQADIYLLTQAPTASIAGSYFSLPRIAQLAIVELILNKIPGLLQDKPSSDEG